MTNFLAALAAVDVLDKIVESTKLLNGITQMIELLRPMPVMFNLDCMVILNESTTSILPSKLNGGTGSKEDANTEDIEEITAMLEEAKDYLNGGYLSDINAVDPTDRLADGELTEDVTEAVNRLQTNLNKLLTNNIAMSYVSFSVFAIAQMLDTLAPPADLLSTEPPCEVMNVVKGSVHVLLTPPEGADNESPKINTFLLFRLCG